MENIEFNKFLETCETGDLLLYSSHRWYSYFIEILGWSKYSHVSMIIKDPTWIHPDLKGLYIFESGLENTNDVIENKHIYGVQLVKLDDALKNYKNGSSGYVYYLKNNFERTETFYDKLKEIILSNDGKPYDLNIIDWIGARFNLQIVHKQTVRYFCSALMAYTLTNLNFLPDNTDWTIVSPKEFSYYEKMRLKFINSRLEPEKLIVF
jgi:hypothetical protein